MPGTFTAYTKCRIGDEYKVNEKNSSCEKNNDNTDNDNNFIYLLDCLQAS